MPQPSASPAPLTSLRLSLDYPRLDDFVVRYGRNISRAGVFLPMREPLEVGSSVRFEIVLADAQTALRGEGTVSFRAPYEPGANDRLHGIGLRLTRLDAASREVIERVMAYKATHPTDYYEPARDPILSPPSPFAFVAPPEVAPVKPVAAPTVSEAAAPAKAAPAVSEPVPTSKPAQVSAPAAEAAKPAASPAASPAPATAAPVAVAPAANVTAAPVAASSASSVPAAAAPVAASPVAASPAIAAPAATVAPAVAPTVTAKEPPASQKTPLRPLTIPRATLPSKGTPKPSSQTPLVVLSPPGSDKTPVPSGSEGAPSQPAKQRPTDSAQTPRIELPLPAAASGPRRLTSDSTKTPNNSARTPVVTLDAALKESSRSQPAPSSTTAGRTRPAPDERSRHDADEELAALRTPATARSAATPDASKRLQELLTRRPGSGKE